MRKKSFWLSLHPWNPPPERRTVRPGSPRGILRPPRHIRTRRPVSSEAPGHGDAPKMRTCAKRHAGHEPRRRSPFPSVSSSSSSFCLLRFPAVVPVASSAPGFGSRVRFSGPSFQRPFDRVQVSENRARPELCSGAACAAFVHPSGVRPPRSALPGSAPAKSGPVRMAGFPPSGVSGLPPGSGLLFRSFAARFVHGLYLVSFRFQFSFGFRSLSVQLACSVRFVFACFRSFFELNLVFARLLVYVFYIFSAYIIHCKTSKSNAFFIRKYVLFKKL